MNNYLREFFMILLFLFAVGGAFYIGKEMRVVDHYVCTTFVKPVSVPGGWAYTVSGYNTTCDSSVSLEAASCPAFGEQVGYSRSLLLDSDVPLN